MKRIIISALLIMAPLILCAQLRQYPSGVVSIKRTSSNPYAFLSATKSEYSSYNSRNIGILSGANIETTYNIGAAVTSMPSTSQSSGRTYGIVATAGNATNGYNYGAFGVLMGTRNGAAVYGTASNSLGGYIPGKYAGYFNGDVYVSGDMDGVNIFTPSDPRIAKNVMSLNSDAETLGNIMNLGVIKYNYINRFSTDSNASQVAAVDSSGDKQLHYGLSAQELQKVFPDLVYKGQDGYLNVNYIELIPVLIRCVQELNQEVERLETLRRNGVVLK